MDVELVETRAPEGRTMNTMTSSPTTYATSADGTRIAWSAVGTGPVIVVAEGALYTRAMGTWKVLVDSLKRDHTVVGYDRRGRGESDPGVSAFDPQREVEDLRAVIGAAGDDVVVLGVSSGGALALEAARQGVAMRALAVYEAPFIVDDTHAANDPGLADRIRGLVARDRRGDAVKLFLRTVGAPAPMVALMPLLPVWKGLTAVAHTLPHDLDLVLPFEQGVPLPDGHYAGIAVPTLVIAGGKSPTYMRNAQAAIAAQVPGAVLRVLPGQTHMVKAKATAPVLREFFG
jgi:pimeloyl-ACP methyl ester carboxylesterase